MSQDTPPSGRRGLIAVVASCAIGLLAVAALLALALVAARPEPGFVPPPPDQVGGTVTSAVHQGKECSSYPPTQAITCLEQYVEAEGYKGNFKPVLAELDTLLADPAAVSFARPACHTATHALGRIAFEQAGSVRAAFDLGGPTCNMGFYHGVVEALGAAVESPQELDQQVATVCSDFPAGERFQVCAHGIGHAAMVAHDGDLAGSLATCAKVQDRGAEEICGTGVFMEWTNRYAQDGRVPSLEPKVEQLSADLDGAYPPGLCRSMDDPVRKACFNEMFSTLAGSADQEALASSARWCSDGPGADACIAGLGTRLPFILDGDHPSAMQVCLEAGSEDLADECMRAYGSSWASYTHDESEVDRVCQALPPGRERVCDQIKQEAAASSLFRS